MITLALIMIIEWSGLSQDENFVPVYIISAVMAFFLDAILLQHMDVF